MNGITIFAYKSSRKNAKSSKPIRINELIGKEEKISDEAILDQMIGTIEKITRYSIDNTEHRHLELSASCSIEKKSNYKRYVGDIEGYDTTEKIIYYFNRNRIYSINNTINFIYFLYCMVYPYNKLHKSTLYDNPSIRYYMNLYNNWEGN